MRRSRSCSCTDRSIARRSAASPMRCLQLRTKWSERSLARRSKRLGELIPANWRAVVGVELWESVDRLLNRYHRMGGRRHQQDGLEGVYAFQGLMRCDHCGERLQIDRQWKKRKRTGDVWA